MPSPLEEEKREVIQLRKEGLTLQEIAHKLGKSIYWVNSRLDSKYEPKRKRRVAKDESEASVVVLSDDPILAQEMLTIHLLRQEGLTYEEIANSLNRSVYWVHTRLREAYRPQGARAEKLFQETRVVPFLLRLGHRDVRQYIRIDGAGYSQEADVVSTHSDKIYITEVKLHLMQHQLQTAIGQLTLHRLAYSEQRICPALQIALPEEVIQTKLPTLLVELLKMREGIDIVFVPKEI